MSLTKRAHCIKKKPGQTIVVGDVTVLFCQNRLITGYRSPRAPSLRGSTVGPIGLLQ